jgi:heme exporter protein D
MNVYWNSFADFLAMGGYAGYVWGSFGVTALILVVEPILARRRRKALVARLQRQSRAERSNRGRNGVQNGVKGSVQTGIKSSE